MENSMVRQRYTRRPVAARRRRRVPRAGGGSLRQIMARQMIICVVLLIMVGIVKSINIPATNFVTDKVKYILSYNIELKNVFSYIDKLAGDIRRSIAPATANKPASADNSSPADISALTGTQTLSITPTSILTPKDADFAESGTMPAIGNNTATLSGETPAPGIVEASSSIGNETDEDNSYTDSETTNPETSVLSASSEDASLDLSGMLAPVEGTLSSLFGEKTYMVTGIGKIHNGIDINVEKGSNIKAALDGKVTETGSSPAYGSYIRIKHTNGLQTVYANYVSLIAKKGDIVKKGDIIANISDTSTPVGTHLHFEVWKDGNAVDPLEYISVPAR